MRFQLKSVQSTIAKLYALLNVHDEQKTVDWIEHIADALQLMNAYTIYEDKYADIVINDYKGELPCDFHRHIQVIKSGVSLKETSSSFSLSSSHTDFHKKTVNAYEEYTFKISPPYIITSFRFGEVRLAYQAFPVDEKGLPMIPDHPSVEQAIMAYIIWKDNYANWLNNKIDNNKYLMLQGDWEHYCGQARGVLNMPTSGEMENIKNNWNRLLPNVDAARSQFKTLNEQRNNY